MRDQGRRKLPRPGQIVTFNRSHYEGVLIETMEEMNLTYANPHAEIRALDNWTKAVD
jgi:polyphosphate kinase 2 (PPK2 family)